MQYVSLYSGHKRNVFMSGEGMNYAELEYEHLYNMRDQTMLFLKLCPKTDGYVNEILSAPDDMVKMIGRGPSAQGE